MTSTELAARVREHVVVMTHTGRGSHVGSGLSCADILAVLYHSILRVNPAEPATPERDRFIMSKGHAAAALYAVLAECGFFPVSDLQLHYQNGSLLSGHVSHRVPGVDFSTGSLGHGLGVSCGLALAAKRARSRWRTFTLLSDGECDEGSVWEAALFAAHHSLPLTAIVDYNKLQSLGTTESTLRLEPLTDKWRAFGWSVESVDGHDHDELRSALNDRRQPMLVVAHTVKGRGVSFMEDSVLWHYRVPMGLEYEAALEELRRAR